MTGVRALRGRKRSTFEPISNELLKLPTDVVMISNVLIPVNLSTHTIQSTVHGDVSCVVS